MTAREIDLAPPPQRLRDDLQRLQDTGEVLGDRLRRVLHAVVLTQDAQVAMCERLASGADRVGYLREAEAARRSAAWHRGILAAVSAAYADDVSQPLVDLCD